MKKRIIFSVIIVLPLIICMGFIFYFSSQDTNQSNSISREFTSNIAKIIFQNFDSMNLDFQNTIIYELNLFIRKAAHFSLFLFISAFIYAELVIWIKNFLLSGIITIILCMFYAILDEYHQSFTPGRTPLLKDVFIDTSGAIIGVILSFSIISTIYFIRQKNNSSLLSAN